ncbi:hypothetical protein [Lentzea sp. NPDC059081]|uniref:hypothetical protein n=1 Tax=Lentzea sp. NPDC059081 TaxID=3346719 RepID=UPI0036949413
MPDHEWFRSEDDRAELNVRWSRKLPDYVIVATSGACGSRSRDRRRLRAETTKTERQGGATMYTRHAVVGTVLGDVTIGMTGTSAC